MRPSRARWYAARLPHRWHTCRPQTVELRRDGALLTGTYHCGCGAVTDSDGIWRQRNSRRSPYPAGLCREPESPQTVRTRVAAARHSRARRHPRIHRATST